MSTSLYWKPLPVEPKENNIHDLKWILAQKVGCYDGSYPSDLGAVDSSLIPFLEGIVAAGANEIAKDAQSLIDAINKHGKVRLIVH